MDKFEEHEMKKIRPIIRNWFDGKSDVKETKHLKDKIINDIYRPFDTEKVERKKKNKNEKITRETTNISTIVVIYYFS